MSQGSREDSEGGLGDLLRRLFGKGDESTVGDLVDEAKSSGFALLLIVFAIPTALPMTPPGLTIPFTLVIAMLGIQLVRGKKSPWLPKWIRKRKLSGSKLSGLAEKGSSWIARLEKHVKTRRTSLVQGGALRGIGASLVVGALGMSFPLPFTNSVAALGVVLVGVALAHRDGVLAWAGAATAALTALLVIGITIYGIVFGIESFASLTNASAPA